jgi:hypothetical protein
MDERQALIDALTQIQHDYTSMDAACACLSVVISFLLLEREAALMEYCAPIMCQLQCAINATRN